MASKPTRRVVVNTSRTICTKGHPTFEVSFIFMWHPLSVFDVVLPPKHASITQAKRRSLYTTPNPLSAAAALKPLSNQNDTSESSSSSLAHTQDLPVSRIDEKKVVVGFGTGEWCR